MTSDSAPEVLVVDGANVVGSRPDGWWRDRPGAAARLHARLVATDGLVATGGAAASDGRGARVVLVLEGTARAGVPEGRSGAVEVVHATGEGDDRIVAEAAAAAGDGGVVTVVTADRGLIDRVAAVGAQVLGPGRLLDRLTTDPNAVSDRLD